jgi:putative intracellular protease/amidase
MRLQGNHAGWMLASADVVRGRTVTSWVSIEDDLVHAGARWADQDVVVDGHLITSRTPDDSRRSAASSSRRWPRSPDAGVPAERAARHDGRGKGGLPRTVS